MFNISRKIIIQIFLFIFFFTPVLAYKDLGKPNGFVNDFTNTLNAEQIKTLENKLSDFEKQTSNEISVVMIDSLEGEAIEDFAVDLFADWKIGKKNKDNGILILIAKNDKKMRIEVGYGFEGSLTDGQCSWIINKIMKPFFRENNFYQGIDESIDKIISATKGEYIPETKTQNNLVKRDWSNIIWIFLFLFMWIASVLGRSKSFWAGGVIGGVIGIVIGIIKGFLYFGIISIIFLIPFGLLFDYIVSRNYQKHKALGTVPWWIGGGRGGKGGSGGFGGFGGGSSGGAGASGSW